MSGFDRRLVPRLRPGYRLQWEPAQQAHVLLYPEGMVKLNDSAGAIASLIDGRRSVAAIVAELDYQPDHPLSLTPAMCAALNVTNGSPVRLIAL